MQKLLNTKVVSVSNLVCLERNRSYTVFELYISIDLKFRHMHGHLKSTLYFFVVQTTDLLDDNGVPSFLAYSASGNVSGNLVYVNYGRQQDYKRLRDYNISLNGSIAMIRYGRIFRGSKVCGVATMFILFAILRHKNLPTLYHATYNFRQFISKSADSVRR
jgi:hypothetical protein